MKRKLRITIGVSVVLLLTFGAYLTELKVRYGVTPLIWHAPMMVWRIHGLYSDIGGIRDGRRQTFG